MFKSTADVKSKCKLCGKYVMKGNECFIEYYGYKQYNKTDYKQYHIVCVESRLIVMQEALRIK